jgi:hypothetical protein
MCVNQSNNTTRIVSVMHTTVIFFLQYVMACSLASLGTIARLVAHPVVECADTIVG